MRLSFYNSPARMPKKCELIIVNLMKIENCKLKTAREGSL